MDDLKEALCDGIDSDCWSVYSRDPKTHRVTKQYYLLPNDVAPAQYDGPEMAKRTALSEDLTPLLADLDNGLEVCLSFGCAPFTDHYYQKVPLTRTYLEVIVDCVR